jgi:hypothetical protein
VPNENVDYRSCFFYANWLWRKNAVTQHALWKLDPVTAHGHEWLPLNPTTYRIAGGTVVSNTAGFLHEYEGCVVAMIDNWECQYSDGSGKFGARNGNH